MKALLVIAKRPASGQTKTRLTPPLSPGEAAQLYECFLGDTLDIARAVAGVTRWVYYAPDDAASYFQTLAPDFEQTPQIGADLGERLDHALTDFLARGYRRVVVMDSDSPTLPAAYIAQAFQVLEAHDVVLGPCEDGGYYLIGLKQPQPRLLREVGMSQPNVLRDTLALADQIGVRASLLPAWYDVDTVQALAQLQAELLDSTAPPAPRTRALLATLVLPSLPLP